MIRLFRFLHQVIFFVMEFLDVLYKRRACHHFLPNKEFTEEQFRELIDRVRMTPSGYNAQPWEFILVRDKSIFKEMQEIAFDQAHVSDCSAIIVILGDLNIGRNADDILKDWVKYGYCTEEQVPVYHNTFTRPRSREKLFGMALRNASLAAMTLLFAATDMGFATCPMMGLSQYKLLEFLQVPEDRIPILMVAIGYEDKGKEKPQLPRKSVESMIYKEKFGQKF